MSEPPKCPVCRSIYVRPRVYECGHSICESCMHGTDQYTERYFNELPNYRCPVCRQECIVPWYRRPINQTLEGICQGFPEYDTRLSEIEEVEAVSMEKYEDNIDIAKMAQTERKRLAKKHYEDMLPILVEAARAGSSSVKITCREKVRAISRVFDLFSRYLFRHKIYRVQCLHDEILVSITRQQVEVANEYTNPELRPTSPPPPPPGGEEETFARITRAVNRLAITELRSSEPASSALSGLSSFSRSDYTLPNLQHPRRLNLE